MLRRPALFAVALAAAAVAVSPAFGANLGNSPDAHACQRDGWRTMALSTSPTVPFTSQGACVRAGAARATLVPVGTGGWEPPEQLTARQACEQAGYVYNEPTGVTWPSFGAVLFTCGQPSDGLTGAQVFTAIVPVIGPFCQPAGGGVWGPVTDQLLGGDLGLQPETGWYAACAVNNSAS